MRMRGVTLLVPWICASCVYVHDAARQTAAENAKSGFDAIAAGSPNGDPIKQFTDHRDAVEALTRELHTVRERVALDAMLEIKWSDLRTDEDTAIKATKVDIATEKNEREKLQPILQTDQKNLTGLADKTTKLDKAMSDASKRAAQHAATQELLRSALVSRGFE